MIAFKEIGPSLKLFSMVRSFTNIPVSQPSGMAMCTKIPRVGLGIVALLFSTVSIVKC